MGRPTLIGGRKNLLMDSKPLRDKTNYAIKVRPMTSSVCYDEKMRYGVTGVS